MACQGCGRTIETRLCCPTCINLGRTSVFCGQECFTKNWASHSQLHDLLLKKQAVTEEETSVSRNGASQRPKPARPRETAKLPIPNDVPNGQRNFAPLPGGQSLVSNLGSSSGPAASKSKPRDGAGASTVAASNGGVLDGIFGHARSIFGRPGRSGSAPSRPAGRGGQSPQSNKLGKPLEAIPKTGLASMQTMLYALAIMTIVVGGCFYWFWLREHPNMSSLPAPEDQPDPPDAVPVPKVEARVDSVSALRESDSSGAGADGGLAALRSEVASLKEMFERHDKMLRYVMERFVERTATQPSPGPAGPARPFVVHEASVMNFSAPEFLSKSYQDTVAGQDSPRKRKGAGGDGSSVALPGPDAA